MKSQIEKDIENPVEKLVTSLEVSRKLKDLGIIQESCFYWYLWSDKTKIINYSEMEMLSGSNEIISAFTVTELGAMLSRDIHHTVPDDSAGLLLRLLLRLIDGIKKDHQLNDCDFKEVVEGWNENLKKWRDK